MRRNAITSIYKKQAATSRKESTLKENKLCENVDKGILDRMDINSKNTCFIT